MSTAPETLIRSGWSRATRRLGASSGQGLVELLISLTMLTVVVGGLLSVLDAGQLSLQRADQDGTALTLAEKQLEVYRTVAYANIRLDQTSIDAIPSTDPYVTANAGDSTIPSSAGQVVGGVNGENACTSPLPLQCEPTQNANAEDTPDHRSYRIDTYITYVTPTDGRQTKQVVVVVRDASKTTLPILARLASTFDQANIATG